MINTPPPPPPFGRFPPKRKNPPPPPPISDFNFSKLKSPYLLGGEDKENVELTCSAMYINKRSISKIQLEESQPKVFIYKKYFNDSDNIWLTFKYLQINIFKQAL